MLSHLLLDRVLLAFQISGWLMRVKVGQMEVGGACLMGKIQWEREQGDKNFIVDFFLGHPVPYAHAQRQVAVRKVTQGHLAKQ